MAELGTRRRLRRKLADDSYDIVYLETLSSMVKMSDGSDLEACLTDVGSRLDSVESVIGQLDTVFRTVVGEP